MMNVKCFDNFSQLPESYSVLFNEAERASFDLGREWYAHLAATALPPGNRALLYGIAHHEEDRPAAVLPLRHMQNERALFSLTTYYSSLYAPLVEASIQNDALTSLFKSLKNTNQGWESLKLNPMPNDQSVYNATVDALKRAGWLAFPYFCFGNWYLSVEGRQYDQYSQTLPSRLRNTIKRKSKQFFNRAEGKLEIVTGGDALERAIEIYNNIYQSSWKKPEPFPDFIPGLIRLFSSKGQLRLGIAYTNDIPIAAQIWIVSHGRAAIYKLAYDEKYSNLSAGSILTEHLMRHVIDVDQVDEVDYLVGDDAYKKDWMNHRRERWGIMAYNPRTLRGLVGAVNEMVRRAFKSVWQPLMQSLSSLLKTIKNIGNNKGNKNVAS